jgi:YVTN family beta-propeller protein
MTPRIRLLVNAMMLCLLLGAGSSRSQSPAQPGTRKAGDVSRGTVLVPTGQSVRSAGTTLSFSGRPVDLVLSPDGRILFVKLIDGLAVVDAATMKEIQHLPYEKKERGTMHGIAVSADGSRVFVTVTRSLLQVASRSGETWGWTQVVSMPGFDRGDSFPCGVAVSLDGSNAYVALSRNNTLAEVDLTAGSLVREIPVGVAPFGVVLSADGATAFVTHWGGRRPAEGERVMASAGSAVLVDERGIPNSGSVGRVDLAAGRLAGELAVGLHPSSIVRSPDASRLFVANANSDNVSVIDAANFTLLQQVSVRPDSTLPYGSITDGVAVSRDGTVMLAANAGNNALALVKLDGAAHRWGAVSGFIPTGWFPASVAVSDRFIYVANAKGEGSRTRDTTARKWHARWQKGTVSKIAFPSPSELAGLTRQALSLSRTTASAREFTGSRGRKDIRPVPVPVATGEPSVFKHVVYVLKENRTYDQVFGDMKAGDSDPALCIYGRDASPNHHALASEFALLDNYYCSGIVSADGHQWATQGITSDYQEKAWGTWSRSYDFGTDPLAFAPTDFLWDNALLHGKSFRNYGEFDFPSLIPDTATWFDVYRDFVQGGGKVRFPLTMPLEPLRRYSCPDFPGWHLKIPDVLRLDRFLKEFREYEKSGEWQDLVLVYLPQDHTSGTSQDYPTPRAMVADNDLALGRLVDAISHSRFWESTCIFVNEDDPQDGFDHVDGHRSLCLVVSPYTKRGKVVSTFYNQSSVLHTIERMLGLPPMNQMDGLAPTMEDCFVSKPDFRPYTVKPNIIPLDERNKLSDNDAGEGERFRAMSEKMDFSLPDRIEDDDLNRILWYAAKGPGVPYPEELAGAHGKGLKERKLQIQNDK